jgi:Fe2+ transport system protein FeoA
MGLQVAKTLFHRVCEPPDNRRILNCDQISRNLKVLPFRQSVGVRHVQVLSELNVGESGVLVCLNLPESVQNHLMHMGFVPDALVTALRRAPAGDPTVYGVDGMEIALRRETAADIHVRPAEAEDAASEAQSPELIEAAR